MRTLIALAVAMAVATSSAIAQGTVDFRNDFNSGGVDRLVYRDHVGGTPLVGVNYVASLWFAADADTLRRNGGTPANVLARFSPGASPGTWTLAQPIVILQGVGIGQEIQLQVRVWDSVRYPTFAAALAAGAGYGSSEPFAYVTPAAGSTPDRYYMHNLRAFGLIPEPSLIVLGGLGAAIFVCQRCRRRLTRGSSPS